MQWRSLGEYLEPGIRDAQISYLQSLDWDTSYGLSHLAEYEILEQDNIRVYQGEFEGLGGCSVPFTIQTENRRIIFLHLGPLCPIPEDVWERMLELGIKW